MFVIRSKAHGQTPKRLSLVIRPFCHRSCLCPYSLHPSSITNSLVPTVCSFCCWTVEWWGWARYDGYHSLVVQCTQWTLECLFRVRPFACDIPEEFFAPETPQWTTYGTTARAAGSACAGLPALCGRFSTMPAKTRAWSRGYAPSWTSRWVHVLVLTAWKGSGARLSLETTSRGAGLRLTSWPIDTAKFPQGQRTISTLLVDGEVEQALHRFPRLDFRESRSVTGPVVAAGHGRLGVEAMGMERYGCLSLGSLKAGVWLLMRSWFCSIIHLGLLHAHAAFPGLYKGMCNRTIRRFPTLLQSFGCPGFLLRCSLGCLELSLRTGWNTLKFTLLSCWPSNRKKDLTLRNLLKIFFDSTKSKWSIDIFVRYPQACYRRVLCLLGSSPELEEMKQLFPTL